MSSTTEISKHPGATQPTLQILLYTISQNTPVVRRPYCHVYLQVLDLCLRHNTWICVSWGLRKRKRESGLTSRETQFNSFTWIIPFILINFGSVQQANDRDVFLKFRHTPFRKNWFSLQNNVLINFYAKCLAKALR